MVSALVRRSRGLAGDTVLCSWARYFTLTVRGSELDGYGPVGSKASQFFEC